MTTEHVTKDIEEAIAASKSLLYFTAAWCGPCKSFAPIVEQFKSGHPDVMVVKIDVDNNRDLANLYSVREVPTVIALEHGAEKARHTGMTTETKLELLVG